MNKELPLRILMLIGVLYFPACTPPAPPKPQLTQLQIRELQTREYETTDTKMVIKAVLNVLQDDGFIVKNAVVDLGLITASKELEVEPVNPFPFGSIFPGDYSRRRGKRSGFDWGMGSGWGNQPVITSKNSIIEASANISAFNRVTRVRVNFQRKTVGNNGGTIAVFQIDDLEYYRDFFAKVDKGVFIQKERL